MFSIHRNEIDWGGRKLVLETGRIARQADGAVLCTYGDTVVLCSVVGQRTPKPGINFFPLTVNYQEKSFAAGKIPGGFFKREGRPSEKEVLTSRLIDRPIRPLFHPNFRCETQVIATVLSHDLENDPDVVAMIGSSAALTISGIPFLGPIGAARVGYVDGKYVLNPRLEDSANSALDLIVAGTVEGVLMVESQAKELSEEDMLGAVTFGHEAMRPVINAIIDLAEKCAKEPWALPETPPEISATAAKLREQFEADLREAYRETVKQARHEKIEAVRKKAVEALANEAVVAEKVGALFHDLESDIVRGNILKTGRRIDGRDGKTVRPITAQVGVLPRAHGSALFTRGETQALVVATLGTGEDEQIIDALEGEYRENFMLHYNFPPYSVGEVGRMGSPGRREIGHGKLAWRAIRALLPGKDDFPYTVRVVSEITEFERLIVDGNGVRQLIVAHGCGCAAAACGRRHRHGPHQGGRRLCRAVRHSRGRRSPRRHGLQGRWNGRGRDVAADGHQDHLDHAGDHEDRSGTGEGWASAYSRRDGEGDAGVA